MHFSCSEKDNHPFYNRERGWLLASYRGDKNGTPNSVENAATYKKYISYRTKTETFESLQEYIDMNMEGLRDDIVKLIAG